MTAPLRAETGAETGSMLLNRASLSHFESRGCAGMLSYPLRFISCEFRGQTRNTDGGWQARAGRAGCAQTSGARARTHSTRAGGFPLRGVGGWGGAVGVCRPGPPWPVLASGPRVGPLPPCHIEEQGRNVWPLVPRHLPPATSMPPATFPRHLPSPLIPRHLPPATCPPPLAAASCPPPLAHPAPLAPATWPTPLAHPPLDPASCPPPLAPPPAFRVLDP